MATTGSYYRLDSAPAIVRSRTTRDWLKVDISTMKVADVFANYREIEVGIYDVYDKPFTLNLYDYEFELMNYQFTLARWFAGLSTRALKLTANLPSLLFKEVNYVPLTYFEGQFQLAKRGWHPSHEVPMEDYDDVVVAYNSITSKYLHEHALFTVNGLFMPTTYHAYGVRLLNAGDVIRKTSRVEMGLLNFENVGSVSTIPITPEMVFKVDKSKDYLSELLIKSPKSLAGKTLGIVIGGFLHLLDGLIRPTSDTTATLIMKDVPIIERVIATKGVLDLAFMGLDDLDESVLVSTITNDVNVLKYLTCAYSFLVLIDNKDLCRRWDPVDVNAGLGNYLIDDSTPLGLLVDDTGRGIDYWPKWECGKWALCTEHSHRNTHSFHTTPWVSQARINSAAIGINPADRIRPNLITFYARTK